MTRLDTRIPCLFPVASVSSIVKSVPPERLSECRLDPAVMLGLVYADDVMTRQQPLCVALVSLLVIFRISQRTVISIHGIR